jgi:hypothetical protein
MLKMAMFMLQHDCMTRALIHEPEKDPAWDGTEFFDVEGDDDGDQSVGPFIICKDTESAG